MVKAYYGVPLVRFHKRCYVKGQAIGRTFPHMKDIIIPDGSARWQDNVTFTKISVEGQIIS